MTTATRLTGKCHADCKGGGKPTGRDSRSVGPAREFHEEAVQYQCNRQ
jgi:hypothetical protein